MNIIDRRKHLIVFILIVLEIGTIIFFNVKSFNVKTKVETKKENKIIELTNNRSNMFAIMLEKTPNSEDYLQSTLTSWPTEGYVYNKNRSGCVDGNGNTLPKEVLEYDEINHTAIINTTTTTYCYLYFDLESNSSF